MGAPACAAQGTILLQNAQPAGANATVLSLIAGGYHSGADGGYLNAYNDAAAFLANANTFLTSTLNAATSTTGLPVGSVQATVDPSTLQLFAQYSVQIAAGSANAAALEAAFNSMVQSGVVEQALQTALGASYLNVLGADPVQAQRIGQSSSAAACQFALTAVAPLSTSAPACALAPAPATAKSFKPWYGVGIAFVIAFGVACGVAAAAYKAGRAAGARGAAAAAEAKYDVNM